MRSPFSLAVLLSTAVKLCAANEVPSVYSISERGVHHRVWKKQSIVTNESGFRTNVTSYTELATGLSYWDGTQYRDSQASLEIVADGAASTRAQHALHLNANLNTLGAVTLTLPDGQVMRSHVLGLALHDRATGQSEWLAQIQNSDGNLFPPQTVIYPAALGSLADIRYTFSKSGLEQDILIRTRLPVTPRDRGMNPDSTFVEVWTEFLAFPEPQISERALPDGSVDQSLNFSSMRMGRGAAFLLSGANERVAGTRVSKTWLKLDNRTFLVESVPYRAIEADLATLPPPQAALGQPEKNARVALLKNSPQPMAAREARPMRLAAKIDFDRTKALVLDYVLELVNVDPNSLTLKGDTTYYVSSAFSVTNLTIENTVVKYASGAYIQVYGAVDCQTGPFNPAIFTGKDDHTVGDAISTNSLSGYYASACLILDSTETLHDLRFSYATFGVIVDFDTTIKNAQFTFCQAPIQLSLCNLTLDNVLFYKGTNVFHGGADATVTARHLTVHQYDQLAYAPDNTFVLKLTNSLLVNVTNWGTTNYSTNAAFKVASDSVFQTVGAGAHYLATNSVYRDVGTTNIPTSLANDLRKKTTFPPLVIDPPGNYYGVSQTFTPRAARDTDMPDVGYHLDPIDYALSRAYLTNATIQVSPGTTIAFFNPTNTSWYGLALGEGGKLLCEGRADAKVNLTHYSTVQEMANTNWAGPIYSLVATWSGITTAELRGRFTDVSVLGGQMQTVYGSSGVTWRFTDCQFNSGTFGNWNGSALILTNCLFNRVYTSIFLEDSSTNRFHNCTYYGGTWETYWGANNVVSFTDNLFAGTVIQAYADIASSHIGYTTNCIGRLITTNLNDVTVNSLVFQTGPLGRFYLPTNAPFTNAGSMNATNAGLYWYTTTTDQRPETNSKVDIGFHYIALASTNATAQPLDTDADGVPNYLEDLNGNGVQDVGETSMTRQDSPFVARYEPLGPSSRRTPLIISEIMYHPPAGQNEFIELYNTHHLPQKLDGFIIFDADQRIPLVTFTNFILGAGSFTTNTFAPGTLTDKKKIQLLNNRGAVLLEVKYDHRAPWPKEADAGHSLVLARPSHGEGDPRAWVPSARRGGSPGYAETNQMDFLRAIKINEFLANPTGSDDDSIELHNACNYAVDISGCYLAQDAGSLNAYRIPSGTVLPPRGFKLFLKASSFGVGTSGFGLSKNGDKIFLTNPDQTRVIDAVQFDAQDDGVSNGRTPDGSPVFSELASRSLGGTNGPPLTRQIVINEIMYNPISGSDDDEYIELYNPGTNSVYLDKWKLSGAVSVTITNFLLGPSKYLVIASKTNLTAKYPANQLVINTNLFPTNYSGKLANGGDRLILETNGIVMDEVTYFDGGRWGKWSDGNGSSLELIDPRSDNRLAANWADSDETGKVGTNWTLLAYTNTVDWSFHTNINALEIMLEGAGECLLDNVEVWQNGAQFVTNSTFEIGTNGWTFEGTHDQSSLESTNGYGGGNSLHVRAAGRGDIVANRIRFRFASALVTNVTAEIKARVRWLTGNPDILFRLRGNGLEAAGTMAVPSNLGTPGVANSRARTNHGPAISEVSHWPVVPSPSEPVLVAARIHDPDGVSQFVLKYRADPATNIMSVTMRDDGTLGDALAGDGLFSGTLPGQSAGTMIAFYLEATDAHTTPATARFPSDAPVRECLVRFGDSQFNSAIATYRLWMTQLTASNWIARSGNHNTPLDATFVYGNERAVFNAGALYSGSPFSTPGYTGPTNKLCAYSVKLPEDDMVLGATDFAIEFPVWDTHGQREPVGYWLANELGLAGNHRRFVHFVVNGVPEGARPTYQLNATNQPISANVFEDAQQPNSDMIEEWFPDDSNGDLYKIEVASDTVDVAATLENFLTTGGIKKRARYRWNWRKRAVNGSAHNYTNLFSLVDAVNASSNFTSQVETVMDADQWMRVFAVERIITNPDSYGWQTGHNLYAYKGLSSRWRLFLWDLDVSLGDNNREATLGLFDNTGDPLIAQVIAHPPFRRMFWRGIQDAVNGPLRPATFSPLLDGNYALLNTNYGVTHTNAAPLLSPDQSKQWVAPLREWMTNRYNFLTGQLATVSAPFEISNNNGNNFVTNQSNIVLFGKAPIEVASIRLNGASTNLPITWTAVTNWSVTITLTNGANALTNRGYDRLGAFLTNAIDSIIITNSP